MPFAARKSIQLATFESDGFGALHGGTGYFAVTSTFKLEAAEMWVPSHEHRFESGEGMIGVELGHVCDATSAFTCVHSLQGRIAEPYRAGVGLCQPGKHPK